MRPAAAHACNALAALVLLAAFAVLLFGAMFECAIFAAWLLASAIAKAGA
ncbi:hypothetical protein [Novosphingobium sp. FSW06-99]|nr:hypothetical protein [Novosphingobium sp. FSW06-99]